MLEGATAGHTVKGWTVTQGQLYVIVSHRVRALRASGGLQCGGPLTVGIQVRVARSKSSGTASLGGHLEHRWLVVSGYLRVVGALMVVVWAGSQWVGKVVGCRCHLGGVSVESVWVHIRAHKQVLVGSVEVAVGQ